MAEVLKEHVEKHETEEVMLEHRENGYRMIKITKTIIIEQTDCWMSNGSKSKIE